MVFNLGGVEILLIVAVAYLVFDKKKFSSLGKDVGKFASGVLKETNNAKKEIQEIKDVVKLNVSSENR